MVGAFPSPPFPQPVMRQPPLRSCDTSESANCHSTTILSWYLDGSNIYPRSTGWKASPASWKLLCRRASTTCEIRISLLLILFQDHVPCCSSLVIPPFSIPKIPGVSIASPMDAPFVVVACRRPTLMTREDSYTNCGEVEPACVPRPTSTNSATVDAKLSVLDMLSSLGTLAVSLWAAGGVQADKTALIDIPEGAWAEAFAKELKKNLGSRSLDYLILGHFNPRLGKTLAAVRTAAPHHPQPAYPCCTSFLQTLLYLANLTRARPVTTRARLAAGISIPPPFVALTYARRASPPLWRRRTLARRERKEVQRWPGPDAFMEHPAVK